LEHQYRRILIVRTDRIGDVVLTLPVAKVLRENSPQAHIAMLIRRYTTKLVEGNRCVNQILYYDNGEQPVPFFTLASMLRIEHFDVVIHIYPRFRLALITWLAGIPVRVGTGYRWYSFLFNKKVYEHRKDATKHELQYNLNLLKVLGCDVEDKMAAPSLEVKPDAGERVKGLLEHLGVPRNSKLVILHPGSGGSAREWSAGNFGLLGKQLSQLPAVKVLITGGKGEQKKVDDVQAVAGSSAVALVDKLSLDEYAALASMSSLLIANSTGTIHIAAAVGTPVIGLYPHVAPMTVERWGPITDRKAIFAPKNKPLDCRKCIDQCLPVCECMESIAVEEVFEAAKRFLADTTDSHLSP